MNELSQNALVLDWEVVFRGKSADRLLWRPLFQGVREEYVIKPP
jgi:urease alpha subunit